MTDDDFERIAGIPEDDTPPTSPDAEDHPPREEPRREKNGKKPYRLVLARDITLESTVTEFLIDGFLGRREQSIWFGEPESGKSTTKIDAACHVAAGLPWCSRKVMQGPVLYVAAERGHLVRKRVLAWRLEHEIDDFPLAVIDDAVDLRNGNIDLGRIIEAAQALGSMCGKPVVWIIFDTLSRVLAGGDENSSRDMGSLFLNVDRIHRATKAHTSLVHHVPLGNGTRMRGHGLANGAADTTVCISKQNGAVTVAIDKANDLADDEKPVLRFRFKSVTLSTEPRRMASVMVEDKSTTTDTTKSKPKGDRKLSDRQKLALDALNSCAADLGKAPPESFGLPKGLQAVTVDQWRDEIFSRGVIEQDHKNPRTAFQQVRDGLKARGVAGERDGLIWPVRAEPMNTEPGRSPRQNERSPK